MKRTFIGFLHLDDYFYVDDIRYRVGHLINNTNGYVACVSDDKKVHRFYIDTIVNIDDDLDRNIL